MAGWFSYYEVVGHHTHTGDTQMDEPNMDAMHEWLIANVEGYRERVEVRDLAEKLILEGELAVQGILGGKQKRSMEYQDYRKGTGPRPSTFHNYVLPWLTRGVSHEALAPLVSDRMNGTLEKVILAAAAAYNLPSDYPAE